jgi:hypothetical protein
MLDLNATLDNLIALVVVILALSLVVQAVQSAVKKVFKLKSRQIEDSLAHLFQFVLNDETVNEKGMKGRWAWFNRIKEMVAQSPFLRIFTTIAHPADRAAEFGPQYEQGAALYNAVMKKFKGIGRVAYSARPIFDSMSKGDLMKVVASLDPTAVDNSFVKNFVGAAETLGEVYRTYAEWERWFKGPGFASVKGLSDDDRRRLAEMNAKVEPLLQDLRLLLTGESGSDFESIRPPDEVTVKRLASDIVRLRSINLEDAQRVIDDVKKNVEQSAARAQLAGDVSVAAVLGKVDRRVRHVSEAIASFRQAYTAVFARWAKLEDSFDSIMQSFEERYTRSMKTAAIVISLLVVAFLNANFFNLYETISTSDAKREMIIQSRQQVADALARVAAATPAADQAARDAQTRQTVKAWFEESRKEVDDNAAIFAGYGFQPVTLQDVRAWGRGWRDGDPWTNTKHDLKVLLGWLVMALLLSVGAPFWQDFLESLFGVKNVLRKKSDTKNVEQEPGTGQPRQS